VGTTSIPAVRTLFAWLIRARVPLSRIQGVRISIHWSWFAFLAWFSVRFASRYSSWIWAATEFLALFAVVLLHEIGHAFALRRFGVKAVEIILWPLGGFTLPAKTMTWQRELIVAGAGPAVNLVLAPVLLLAWYEFGYRGSGDMSRWLWDLALQNLALLLFNLLPIWPLDGGRLAEALTRGAEGPVRSAFAVSILGLICSCLGCVCCRPFRAFDVMAVFVALIFANVALLNWSTLVLRRERRFGIHATAICPHCGSKGLGENWNYSADSSPITCQYCFESSHGRHWLSAAPRLASVSSSFRLDG
jgi:Zn-dependent protease